VGVALALGLLTRLAALAGVTMNLAFLWAGTTSTNPPLLLLGLGLVFFGHRPGRFGVDGWLFPWLRERLPAEARRLGREALFIAALLAGAWLALVASDLVSWLALAAAAAAATLAVRSRPIGRSAGGHAWKRRSPSRWAARS